MERILTLLLVFLISLAPAAPGEAGRGHTHAMAHASVTDEAAHAHGTEPTAEALVVECSIVGGHCVAGLVVPVGESFKVGYSIEICSLVLAQVSSRGIVLTAEPPPPRA